MSQAEEAPVLVSRDPLRVLEVGKACEIESWACKFMWTWQSWLSQQPRRGVPNSRGSRPSGNGLRDGEECSWQ